MERYVCIHGHFYQPPRENPWLEAVELQDSAYPYHDWNERVTAECYGPNSRSRILADDGRIVKILNNYSKISFNIGPTLLAWLGERQPDVYQAILDADRESMEHFSGHGSAIAQCYNHMIVPLANTRDKRTQVHWGIEDFKHRFGRKPEGMWLPETAVDVESLEVLAEHGIAFTILAPHQASRVRRIGGRAWRDVSGDKIDPSRPYQVRLPSGRSIAVFFYDGPISRAVAFEGLLSSGEALVGRLWSGLSEDREWSQMVHIATDGESYGHHHRHGDMALAYALDSIEARGLGRLTNYGEYLERHPPTHQAEVHAPTSWSCAHGVERWRSDCGCNSGGRPGWNQAWRAPLRDALDWLRDEVAPLYEQHGVELFTDPWAARDDYISVVLDRSRENTDAFLHRNATRKLNAEERIRALKLLELQRHAMLMYTSCGWFFDDLSGIETVQVIQYAGRVIQLAQELFHRSIEAPFLERLAGAVSNVAEHGNGGRVYEKSVKPAMVDLEKVCAHYAVSSVFEESEEEAQVYCYRVECEAFDAKEAGRSKLALGRARVTSDITGESSRLNFCVLHFGDQNVNGGVREVTGDDRYDQLVREATAAFEHADFAEVIRVQDRHFGESTYSIRSLFRDEQRKVLDQIIEVTLEEAETSYRQVYEHHAPLMRFLVDLGVPLPRAFRAASDLALNSSLRRAFEEEELDVERAEALLEEARTWPIDFDAEPLTFALEGALERVAAGLDHGAEDLEPLIRLEAAVGLARSMPFEVDLWTVQNVYYEMLQSTYPERRRRAERGDQQARAWAEHFVALGEKLAVRVE